LKELSKKYNYVLMRSVVDDTIDLTIKKTKEQILKEIDKLLISSNVNWEGVSVLKELKKRLKEPFYKKSVHGK